MHAYIVVSLMAGVRPEEARAMFRDVCERAGLGTDWAGPPHPVQAHT